MFKYLKSFNSEMISKDIKVIYVPPIYNESASILDSKFIEESVSELRNRGVNFIEPPKDYFYTNEYFFDTIYHLNKKGIDKRMLQLSNDLNSVIK